MNASKPTDPAAAAPPAALPAAPPAATPTVLVADPKPLSLLATAGVLHHEGMQCLCARTPEAVLKAFGITAPLPTEEPLQARRTRVDAPHAGPSPSGTIDLIVWDVGDDPATVLETLAFLRSASSHADLPAILIADPQWAGLEKKTETLRAATVCLFKPIDPKSLSTIATQWMWMPSLQASHRQRGGRPQRPGWVTL